MELEIVVKKETGEIAEMLLRGRVDMQTTELLKGRIAGLLEEGFRHILLNMRRVNSSTAWAWARDRRGGRVLEANGSLRLIREPGGRQGAGDDASGPCLRCPR